MSVRNNTNSTEDAVQDRSLKRSIEARTNTRLLSDLRRLASECGRSVRISHDRRYEIGIEITLIAIELERREKES